MLDWCQQIGFPLAPLSAGTSFAYPGPTGYDGVLTAEHDHAASAAVLAHARDFIFGGLNTFDQSDLSSMGLARFFHKNIKWDGPGGIGACLSLQEFVDLHQRPWLVARPDRAVRDLDTLIAEDRIVGASSFPGVLATHTGLYRDMPATGNRIHLWAQFGIDLMARLRRMTGR